MVCWNKWRIKEHNNIGELRIGELGPQDEAQWELHRAPSIAPNWSDQRTPIQFPQRIAPVGAASAAADSQGLQLAPPLAISIDGRRAAPQVARSIAGRCLAPPLLPLRILPSRIAAHLAWPLG